MGMWMQFMILAAGRLLLLASGAQSRSAGCQASCGGVDIPYPFGIGSGCFHSKGMEIACNNGLVATLGGTGIQVLNLSVDPVPEVKVMLPVAYECHNSRGQITSSFNSPVVDFTGGDKGVVYRISGRRNKLVVLGCSTMAYIKNNNVDYSSLDSDYYTGCISYCNGSRRAQDGWCGGAGCCQVDIPAGGLVVDNAAAAAFTFRSWPQQVELSGGRPSCDYAFLVAKDDGYHFRRDDLNMNLNQTKPVWLDWALRRGGNASSGCTCTSANSECVNSTINGYYCKCSSGYEGNPYDDKGCKDIDECTGPREQYPCYGVCRNTPGDYECSCRRGSHPSGGGPKKHKCKFPLAAQLAIGISMGFFFVIVAVLFTLMMLHKRKINKIFKKNGGSVQSSGDNNSSGDDNRTSRSGELREISIEELREISIEEQFNEISIEEQFKEISIEDQFKEISIEGNTKSIGDDVSTSCSEEHFEEISIEEHFKEISIEDKFKEISTKEQFKEISMEGTSKSFGGNVSRSSSEEHFKEISIKGVTKSCGDNISAINNAEHFQEIIVEETVKSFSDDVSTSSNSAEHFSEISVQGIAKNIGDDVSANSRERFKDIHTEGAAKSSSDIVSVSSSTGQFTAQGAAKSFGDDVSPCNSAEHIKEISFEEAAKSLRDDVSASSTAEHSKEISTEETTNSFGDDNHTSSSASLSVSSQHLKEIIMEGAQKS